MALTHEEQLVGCLVGMAVGDSLGLPAEGLSRSVVRKRFPGPWRQRFFCERGMISDDTEHAFFIARSLLDSDEDTSLFAQALAGRLRWWLLGLPAGVGFATLRACLKLWWGYSPQNSGVFSAGNGPAMRAPVLGVYFQKDIDRLNRFVVASTRLTHTDPKAITGASIVARFAASATRLSPNQSVREAEVLRILRTYDNGREWQELAFQFEEATGRATRWRRTRTRSV